MRVNELLEFLDQPINEDLYILFYNPLLEMYEGVSIYIKDEDKTVYFSSSDDYSSARSVIFGLEHLKNNYEDIEDNSIFMKFDGEYCPCSIYKSTANLTGFNQYIIEISID